MAATSASDGGAATTGAVMLDPDKRSSNWSQA
jgi:hypothetical protein